MNEKFKTLMRSGVVASLALSLGSLSVADVKTRDHFRAKWDPIHFQPAIANATDEQCLSCHREVIDSAPLKKSPAGLPANAVKAWYQTLDTYRGEQQTFHARHLTGEYGREVMALSCTTCHQGNDPRDETSGTSTTAQPGLTMRKAVDPWICVMCHGQFDYQKMGIPGPWTEHGNIFGDSCLTCHAAIKTERHKNIPFLKDEAIEAAAKKSSDVCYGCHGGRAWYRVAFPYAERKWPGWGQPPKGAEKKYPGTQNVEAGK